MTDLSSSYLGLKLKNPLIASSSPLSERIGNIRQMEDAGMSAVVLHSLFEEQITLQSIDLDRQLSQGAESFAEALSYFPDMTSYNLGPDGYLEHIQKAKAAVDIPIIGSLNGYSTGGWIRYAKLIEEAGADALELNIYYISSNPDTDSHEVELHLLELISNIRTGIKIPMAVKLSPYFSALSNMAMRLVESGADGLVIFNRFYQPDFDLEELTVTPNLKLSTSDELLLRLRWIAMLQPQVEADLAITGGVHTPEDVVKAVMAGANAAMMTSALLRHGIDYAAYVAAGLLAWLEEHEYESIAQMCGSMSQRAVSDPAAFERANYMTVLRSGAFTL